MGIQRVKETPSKKGAAREITEGCIGNILTVENSKIQSETPTPEKPKKLLGLGSRDDDPLPLLPCCIEGSVGVEHEHFNFVG